MKLIRVPAQYAKFITSLLGMFVVYVEQYGFTWQAKPALLGIAAALAVLGVPNAEKPKPPT